MAQLGRASALQDAAAVAGPRMPTTQQANAASYHAERMYMSWQHGPECSVQAVCCARKVTVGSYRLQAPPTCQYSAAWVQ
jgi:hypothetical protein